MDGRAGHYQSLVPVNFADDADVDSVVVGVAAVDSQIGGLSEDSLPTSVVVTANTRPEDIPVSVKLASEEKILRKFPKETALVVSSLERIREVMSKCTIKPEDLFQNSLCSTLYNHIRPVYSVRTSAGKKARKIIVALQNICLLDPRCPRNLPSVSDCDSPPAERSSAPDFLGLFTGGRVARILSDEPSAGSSPPLHSTVVQPRYGLHNFFVQYQIYSSGVPDQLYSVLQEQLLHQHKGSAEIGICKYLTD